MKCKCGAFINPAWTVCMVCKGPLSSGVERKERAVRRRLYSKQNALVIRLMRRIERLGIVGEIDPSSWASDEAVAELYAGRRSWTEQRRRIYQWARCEIACIRRHREKLDGVKCNASDGVRPLIRKRKPHDATAVRVFKHLDVPVSLNNLASPESLCFPTAVVFPHNIFSDIKIYRL